MSENEITQEKILDLYFNEREKITPFVLFDLYTNQEHLIRNLSQGFLVNMVSKMKQKVRQTRKRMSLFEFTNIEMDPNLYFLSEKFLWILNSGRNDSIFDKNMMKSFARNREKGRKLSHAQNKKSGSGR